MVAVGPGQTEVRSSGQTGTAVLRLQLKVGLNTVSYCNLCLCVYQKDIQKEVCMCVRERERDNGDRRCSSTRHAHDTYFGDLFHR